MRRTKVLGWLLLIPVSLAIYVMWNAVITDEIKATLESLYNAEPAEYDAYIDKIDYETFSAIRSPVEGAGKSHGRVKDVISIYDVSGFTDLFNSGVVFYMYTRHRLDPGGKMVSGISHVPVIIDIRKVNHKWKIVKKNEGP